MSGYLLNIFVSPMGENSSSRKVGKEFVDAYAASHPGVEIKTRDLNANPIPHLDGETLFFAYTPEDKRAPSQVAKNAARIELIDELKGATAVVISTPMWNWAPPSVLKAYVDQIVYPGQLDPYGNAGLAGKAITVIIATGGAYEEDSSSDFESQYFKFLFNKLGSTDVAVIRIDNQLGGSVPHLSAEQKEAGLTTATSAAKARAAAI